MGESLACLVYIPIGAFQKALYTKNPICAVIAVSQWMRLHATPQAVMTFGRVRPSLVDWRTALILASRSKLDCSDGVACEDLPFCIYGAEFVVVRNSTHSIPTERMTERL